MIDVSSDLVGTNVIEGLYETAMAAGWTPTQADLYVQGYLAGYWKRGERERLAQLQQAGADLTEDYSCIM